MINMDTTRHSRLHLDQKAPSHYTQSNQYPMMSSSNDSGDEVESTDSAKSFRKTKLIFYLVNMLFFGVSVLLFVVGISYLTIYRYDYSLTIFSTTLIAGIFIAFSVVLFVLSFLNVIFIQTSRRRALSASLGGVLLVLVVLLAFGIWGLATSSNRDYLNDEVRLDLMQTFQQYNERRTDKFETMKIDWVQTKFNCCGVDSYADWRAFFLYGGQYKPINYVDQWSVNNNLPYVDNVPDSCCSVPSPNCGKYHRQQQPSIYASEVINFNYQFGGRDNQMLIYTKGCVTNFVARFILDIQFLAGLSTATAAVCILLWSALLFIYFIMKVNK